MTEQKKVLVAWVGAAVAGALLLGLALRSKEAPPPTEAPEPAPAPAEASAPARLLAHSSTQAAAPPKSGEFVVPNGRHDVVVYARSCDAKGVCSAPRRIEARVSVRERGAEMTRPTVRAEGPLLRLDIPEGEYELVAVDAGGRESAPVQIVIEPETLTKTELYVERRP